MALYVVHTVGKAREETLELHIGSRVSLLNRWVSYVQADGDELELIRRQFSGIPISTARVIAWREPWAQFIADNIRLEVNNTGSESDVSVQHESERGG